MARAERSSKKKNKRLPPPSRESSLRRQVYRVLEAGHILNWKVLIFEASLITLILANVVAVTLDSVKSISDRYDAQFDLFETVSVVIFAIEYAVRLWVSIEDPRYAVKGPFWGRLRYLASPEKLFCSLVRCCRAVGASGPLLMAAAASSSCSSVE